MSRNCFNKSFEKKENNDLKPEVKNDQNVFETNLKNLTKMKKEIKSKEFYINQN